MPTIINLDPELVVFDAIGIQLPANPPGANPEKPWPACIFAVQKPYAEIVWPGTYMVSARKIVSLVTSGPDWVAPGTAYSAEFSAHEMIKLSALPFKVLQNMDFNKKPFDQMGTFHSETRTRLSFWLGSADIVETSQNLIIINPWDQLPPPQYIYARGFDADGVAVCNTFVTTDGLFRATDKSLHIREGFLSLSSPVPVDELNAVAALPGLTIGASSLIRWQAQAQNPDIDGLYIQFTVGGQQAWRAELQGFDPFCYAQLWNAHAGFDAHAGAFLLRSCAGAGAPPAVWDGFPGEMRYEYIVGGASKLYMQLANGSWNAFPLS